MDILHQKKQHLEACLKELGSIVIAFSSGVDSAFLLKTAHDLLGDKVIAVTAHSCLFPQRETDEAAAFCEREQIRHILFETDPFTIEGFRQNPKNRCYLCKYDLLTRILQIAKEQNIPYVAEGSNLDDTGDYRPGLTAVAELGIKSPLREAGLTKEDIRQLSKELGLPTWNKPSFACLASRFVYGEPITKETLSMADRAEQKLLELGFSQFRVRIHGCIARIEILPSEFPKLLTQDTAVLLNRCLQEIGFTYVTLDLGGYKTGSMNKTL